MWSSLLLVGVVYRRVHGSRHVLVDRGPHRLRGVGALGFLPRRLSLGPAVLRPAHRRRLLGSFVPRRACSLLTNLETWGLFRRRTGYKEAWELPSPSQVCGSFARSMWPSLCGWSPGSCSLSWSAARCETFAS